MPAMMTPPNALVVSVNASGGHNVRKEPAAAIHLVENHGVAGDAHAGTSVQHLHARRKEPAKPNLRQVHLIGRELLDDLALFGHEVTAGDLGENILTAGMDLAALPAGTLLHVGPDAVVRVTGKRNPCSRINEVHPGLMKHCFTTDPEGRRTGRIGVLGVVVRSGTVRPDDPIVVEWPAEPHRALEYV